MDFKKMAGETLAIMEQGYYETEGRKITIAEQQDHAVGSSILLTPEQGEALLETCGKETDRVTGRETVYRVRNSSAVDVISELWAEGRAPAILNFASAKNPGGGFINGAMAQEESLAMSSCLYRTQTVHETYYTANRACGTMMYTDHAIYARDVVFFRDGDFRLLKEPVTASILTLPAVNMGQVIVKGEDITLARQVMKRRMKLALAVFERQGCRHLILGAYGCGVFRNDPEQIAAWWKELLEDCFAGVFETIVFAVLDRKAGGKCIAAFEHEFGCAG